LRNLKQPNATAFTTSLYEINQLIEQKELKEIQAELRLQELANKELIKKLLPKEYSEFKDLASKATSDVLPPHWQYDMKIELEKDSDLGFSPLRHLTLEELQAYKQYLVNNLSKGFIVPSQALFAALILFVHKANSGLRFCVDYRKLNAATLKDRYLIPLLEETLSRISKAKVFTKLDVRQAFH